jgi:PAS domain S-box-containing protein
MRAHGADALETRLSDDLRASELLELVAIVESSEDAIISKDLDGTIRSWNLGAERLYGYSPAEAIGRPIAMLAPPDREDEIPMIIERIRRGERVEHFETRRRHKDGHDVYVSLTVSPVRGEDGAVVAASIIARDITKRHEAEVALRESERRLQAALAESRRNQRVAESARREAEALARRLEDIRGVVEVGHTHSSLDELLQGLLQYVHGRLESDATSILLVDDDKKFEQRVAIGRVDDRTVAMFATVSQSLIHRVFERHAPILLDDTRGIGEPRARGPGVGSLIGVPLLVRGELIGSLCTGQLERRAFTTDDVHLLQLTADRAAIAIANARLYENATSVAETLQRSLLPKRLPSSPSAQVAARYVPAARGMEVGGDWYDAVELSDGRLVLMVGDVVGHGIEAAATMGQLRHALRAFVLEGHSPSSAIEQLESVTSYEERGMATIVCLVVDPATGSARFANAGHPPPLLLRPDGGAAYLEGGRSLPVGVLKDCAHDEAEVWIEPGSTILLYTDGLVERRGASIDDGFDRLVETATRGPDDVDELLANVMVELVGKQHPFDDVALVALKVLAGHAAGTAVSTTTETTAGTQRAETNAHRRRAQVDRTESTPL